jgi:hypothetical protein
MRHAAPLAAPLTCMVLVSLVPAISSADDCKHAANRTVSIDGPGITKVVLETRAGDLDVRGEAGEQGVRARGEACASSKDLLDALQFESRRDGDTVYVKVLMPDNFESLFGFNRYAYMDVKVTLPKTVALSLQDTSGDLRVSDVQSARIDDNSGDQSVHDIAGDLDITDSSGEIEVGHVGGTLKIRDNSGAIDVTDVRGDVIVTADSSGEIEIEKVAGKVHIVSDSSGDIDITDVQRDVIIDEDSSGAIAVSRVGGNFTVGSDGSGGVSYNDVLGSVRLPDED